MKNNNTSSDKVPDDYQNSVWDDGKCQFLVTEESLKETYKVWKSIESKVLYRKDATFENFIDLNDLAELVGKLDKSNSIICNEDARICSCGKFNCKVHYFEHLEKEHKNKEDKGDKAKSKDEPKNPPPSDEPYAKVVPSIAGVG